jgi:hypothetical protein
MTLFFLIFLSGCNNPDNDTDPNTDTVTDTETDVDTDTDADTDADADTDTGTETGIDPVCGGPEPPEDSLWECYEGEAFVGEGPAWPVSGGPEDAKSAACQTTDGWVYEMSEDGNSVHLVRQEDRRELDCEMTD